MKYIMFGDVYPVAFPEFMEHYLIKAGSMKATSAGYFEIIDGKVHVFGESFALNLSPKEGDEYLLQKMIEPSY